MKSNQIFLIVAIALVCGGLAGYCSARFVDAGSDQTVVSTRQLRFIDGSGNHQVTLELESGRGHKPGLVLKDSTGKMLYELPPSVKIQPLERL